MPSAMDSGFFLARLRSQSHFRTLSGDRSLALRRRFSQLQDHSQFLANASTRKRPRHRRRASGRTRCGKSRSPQSSGA